MLAQVLLQLSRDHDLDPECSTKQSTVLEIPPHPKHAATLPRETHLSLKIPPHLKHVATLPCETCLSLKFPPHLKSVIALPCETCLSLKFPPHLKHVATIPCEMFAGKNPTSPEACSYHTL